MLITRAMNLASTKKIVRRKVIKRHEDALMNRIDEVGHVGWTTIYWWEAYAWYNADRIGKRFYRDLRDRYHHEGNEGELHIYPGAHAILLISGDKLTSVSAKIGEENLSD